MLTGFFLLVTAFISLRAEARPVWQKPDSTSRFSFLDSYRDYLIEQSHRLRWIPEIVGSFQQQSKKNLVFRQEVSPLNLRPAFWDSLGIPFQTAADQWIAAHSGAGYAPIIPVALSDRNLLPHWEKYPKKHLTSLPSDLEIEVLDQLWSDPLATDPELYIKLPPYLRITAEQFEQVLSQMVREGLLARKQVSPQNLFTILTPFGATQIEESSLNRKNRVFQYRPLVNRKEILSLVIQKVGRQKRLDRTLKKLLRGE
ncbi:MAG: hypothetical protein GXO76_01360 [Calditrichaeota bacterium]|nr:hypothetical protein [Calditrichota bacterium]